MGRDGGTGAGAAGDNASERGSITAHQPEVCRESDVGTLLSACWQQEDKLHDAAVTGCQRLLLPPLGSSGPVQLHQEETRRKERV